jgi:hypothetical protein
VLAARSARAEDSGFALGRFEPAEAGGHWFGGETLDFRGNFRPAVGFVLDYAHQPLVATDKSGDVVATIVEKQTLAHLGASFVLQNRLRIGVDLPLQLQAKGNTTSLGADTVAAPASSFAVGDLRLGIDDRLYGRSDGPFTAAIGLRLHLPTGDRASYTSDGSVRVVPRFMVAGKSGSFEWTGRVDYHTRDVIAYGTTKVGSELGVVATAGVRAAEGKLLIGPEVFAATALADGAFANPSSPVEALLGAHYHVTPSWIIGAGAGGGITGGYGTPTYRGVLSVAWSPEPADTDGDGIHDDIDACVAVKGVESDSPCKNGCPLDQDGDGIIDAEDACIAVAGIKTTDAHTNGCQDKDADGIVDSADACPDGKGIASNDSKANGCPDKDGDGITDANDKCPDVKGLEAFKGCPDTDGDGFEDSKDACPTQPETKNGVADDDGCPDTDKSKVSISKEQIFILEQVLFDTNKATIRKESFDLLDQVAKVFVEHPEIKRVLVEGHTDDVGKDESNMKLSDNRAKAVVAYLVKKGVEAARLDAKGFGETKPVVANDSKENRQKNRRVVFTIVDPAPTK